MPSISEVANQSNPTNICAQHGAQMKRDTCRKCNAAYMRSYQRLRRRTHPVSAILERAKERARRRSVEFNLSHDDITIPERCPALGIPIETGAKRHDGSPSLDRISPHGGYVPGNVRVISDKANRLKGSHSLETLRLLALQGHPDRRSEFKLLVKYVERESLLGEVRKRAQRAGRAGEEWSKIEAFLDRAFRQGREQFFGHPI